MTIAIDRGNTLTKATLVADDGAVIALGAVDDAEDAGMLAARLWRESGCEGTPRGVCCSVGCDDGLPMNALLRDAPGDWLELSHTTHLPIDIEYTTPRTLGLDRIAAACGAAAIAPGEICLVVDAGTALTLDLLDASSPRPRFRGGNISPGLRLRARALSDHTGRLPLVATDEYPASEILGGDTRGAIRTGIFLGITGEIELAFRKTRLKHGASRLIITGGDASIIKSYADSLPADDTTSLYLSSATCIPNLLALGLSRIYEYNRRQ